MGQEPPANPVLALEHPAGQAVAHELCCGSESTDAPADHDNVNAT